VGADGTKIRPRKRVSLFLRRRGRFRGGNVPHSVNPVPRNDADTDASGTETQHFRRAQSHFVKPVSVNNEGAGGTSYIPASESGRYMEYAADFDFTRTINSLRKLRPSAIRIAPPQTTTAVTTDPSASGVSGLQPNNNNNNNNNLDLELSQAKRRKSLEKSASKTLLIQEARTLRSWTGRS